MDTSSASRAVVFDLDGTLVEVGARDYAVYRDLLLEDGLTPLPFERYWPMRRERTRLVDLLSQSSDAAGEYLPGFVARRAARYERADYFALDTVLPTVTETLTAVGQRFDCVLITSRTDAEGTEQQLEALGLRRLLRTVQCCNGDKTAALGLVGGVALVVGDTEHDIRMSAHHGYPCFAVTTGMRSRGFLSRENPAHLGDSLAELLGIL